MPRNRFAATGLSGLLGTQLADQFKQAGWEKIELLNSHGAPWRLGDELKAGSLKGAGVFIHCAHDFSCKSLEESRRVNIDGSVRLFEQLIQEGVAKICFISSISSYEDAQSIYGRTKFEIEKFARTRGITILRPGLIANDRGLGIFGKLDSCVKRLPVVPLLGDGGQLQYLVTDREAAQYVLQWACSDRMIEEPVFLAHPDPFRILDILRARAHAHGVRRFYLPIPISFVRLILRLGEVLGIPLPFRSDSLTGLLTADPTLSRAPQRARFVLPPVKSVEALLGE